MSNASFIYAFNREHKLIQKCPQVSKKFYGDQGKATILNLKNRISFVHYYSKTLTHLYSMPKLQRCR